MIVLENLIKIFLVGIGLILIAIISGLINLRIQTYNAPVDPFSGPYYFFLARDLINAPVNLFNTLRDEEVASPNGKMSLSIRCNYVCIRDVEKFYQENPLKLLDTWNGLSGFDPEYSLWLKDASGIEREIVKSGDVSRYLLENSSQYPANERYRFRLATFSPDNKKVYFISDAVTDNHGFISLIFSFDIETGKLNFVTDGEDIAFITKGPFLGNFITLKIKDGAFVYFIIDEFGNELKYIGGWDDESWSGAKSEALMHEYGLNKSIY